jgi:hypothetical protein
MPKNEVDDFLNDVNPENNEFTQNEDPFEQDLTPEPKVEDTVEPKEEKPLPFNKDPKIQRFIDKQIAKALESKGTEEQTFKREQPTDEDDYYVRLIGNDTPEKLAMIREAKARDERMLDLAEERAFGRLTKEQQQSVEADRQAEEQLETSLEEIEESYGVDLLSETPTARKTRTDFMKFVEKIAPKNSRGEVIDYPDMNSAFETWQETKKTSTQPNRAKELASRSMARSGEAIPTTERMSFDNVDSIMDKILGR